MQRMTEAERRQFLTAPARTMQLATTRADGRPHVAPIWFDLDGDTIVFTTGPDSVKGVNLRRDPRVALCVDDEAPPFAYVLIEGTADLSAESGDVLHWATRIGGKYMGADQAEAFGKRNSPEGELLVRVTPTKIVAVKGVTDW